MPHSWPAETVFRQLTLDVDDRSCPHCGQTMHVCQGHRTLSGLAGQHLHQEVNVPATQTALHDQAFFAGMLLEKG